MSAYGAEMQDYTILLGRRVRAIRTRLGLTQEEFAERAGITQGRLSRLESGQGFKSVQNAAELIVRAGGDPEELFVLQEGKAPEREKERLVVELVALADEKTLEAALAVLRLGVERGKVLEFSSYAITPTEPKGS